MADLSAFRDLDYMEQVMLLKEITDSKDSEALEGLLDLQAEPIGDTAVDYMVTTALHAVLSANEDKAVEGLSSPDPKVRDLCIKACVEHGFTGAATTLAEMAEEEEDEDVAFDILTALSRLKDPDTLDVFRKRLHDDDPFIASLCLDVVAEHKDEASMEDFKEIVRESEEDENYLQCDITTWKAVNALGAIGTDDALAFLATYLHHKNPTARRIITDTLVYVGPPATPHVADMFETTTSKDDRILCANVLGFIGDKKGGDALVEALDAGKIEDPNLKYAVYEALGRIGGMKSVICLMDALADEDEMILMAVVRAMDKNVNPGLAAKLVETIKAGGSQSARIGRAIIGGQAVNIFKAIYPDPAVGTFLIRVLGKSKDPEVITTFREALEEMDSDQAKADLAAVASMEVQQAGLRILAADDSKSMLALYRGVITDMGHTPLPATNGAEAYDYVEQGEEVSMVITDMNMPVMDGIELVQKIRDTEGLADIPVLMITTESESSQRGMAEQSGVNAFLNKPFGREQLVEIIEQMLPK
ncbi:MAG: HEAT repeat domain-containing protein [Desulfovibrionaceae bacterium]